MTDKSIKFDKLANNMIGKPVPMKLFAAWEVDRTPPNCIPRLCSLTITRLSLLTPLPVDLSSLYLAVKMQSSKRTLRSHEIPVPSQNNSTLGNSGSGLSCNQQPQLINNQQHQVMQGNNLCSGNSNGQIHGQANTKNIDGSIFSSGTGGDGIGASGIGTNNSMQKLLETDLDLHFSLQYPHFIKRDGNRLVILLQRRKKYKSRTILGYKTLAEGVIRMDAVLQKSMDMTVELLATGKDGRAGTTVAILRADRVTSSPVDQDSKNNNSILLADRVNEYSDDDEEFSSGEDNDNGFDVGRSVYNNGVTKRDYNPSKHDIRKYRKLQKHSGNNDGEESMHLGGNLGDSDSEFEIKDKRLSRTKISRTITLQQRNFKQKIFALLKRFKVNEELDGSVIKSSAALRSECELDALFQELESLSCGEGGDDSGPDLDSLSIGSTPKPSIRPFFTNSKIILHDSNIERNFISKNDSSPGNERNTANTDPEGQNSDSQNIGSPLHEKYITTNNTTSRKFRTSISSPGNLKKKQSLSFSADTKSVFETCLSPTNVEPRKQLLDQLIKVFSTEETTMLPDIVGIVSPSELYGNHLLARLNTTFTSMFRPTFVPQNTAEVKAVLQALLAKIQKYCNCNAKTPITIKILLLGGDWLQGVALRHYVDLLGIRPPDWVHYLRFFIIPIVTSSISRHLSSIDQLYYSMFGNENWIQLCDRVANLDETLVQPDIIELTNRIQLYLHRSVTCTQIPIAEAMVNFKDEDCSQIFVPFVCDVQIGYIDGLHLSLDLDESGSPLSNQQSNISSGLSSSPSQFSGRNSPSILTTSPLQQSTNQEYIELQIDYWPIIRPCDGKDKNICKGCDQGKNSIKNYFRNFKVLRLPSKPQFSDIITNGMTVVFAAKEKKQKIIRLGKKKEKDRDQEQCIEGVARLICSPKQSNPIPLKVYIDGTEWTGVNFFQLSSQWQTHIKNFPVALIGAPFSSSDLV